MIYFIEKFYHWSQRYGCFSLCVRVHVEASAEIKIYLQWLFFCGILRSV